MNFLNKNNPIVLNKFLKYLLNVKYYSINTINEYRLDIIVFLKFIKEYLNIPIEVRKFSIFIIRSVNREDVLAFLVYLNTTRNCTASTRKRKIASIKAFYKWIYTFYPVENMCNPTENLPSIQEIVKLPKYLTLEEAKKITNIFNLSNCKNSKRNNAIITLFLNCGLRISELSNIKLYDLNLSEGYIKIIGKGNKERLVWLNKSVINILGEYLKVRNKNLEKIDIGQYLFFNRENKRLSIRTIGVIIDKAYELAGLGGKGYTTHTLRHTAATIIYQYVKPDILLLKDFLGHETVKSTEIYTHISNEQVKNAINSNPLSNFVPYVA